MESFIELLKEFINTKDVSESVREQFIYFGLMTKHYAYVNLTKEDLVVLFKNFNELKQLVPSKSLMKKLDKMEIEFKRILKKSIEDKSIPEHTREEILQFGKLKDEQIAG